MSHTFLVTGGTGTLGQAVTRDLLAQGHKVRALGRTVTGHEALKGPLPRETHPRVTTVIGSLSSQVTLTRSSRNCDFLIHAAAMKDISYCEEHPLEAIETNVTGTANVVNVCLEQKIPRCVFVSTDKAAAPTTLYGATKLLGERLWLDSRTYTGGGAPDFVAVRYGNVWGSNRSVLHRFREQMETKGHLTLTDPRSTRFHIKIEQAVELVLKVLRDGTRGTLWVPKLPTYCLGDLATAWMNVHEMSKPAVVTGLRAAEKLHEDLIAPNEVGQIVEERAGGYVLDPRHTGGTGNGYNSGQRTHQLSIKALEQEIDQWRSDVQ